MLTKSNKMLSIDDLINAFVEYEEYSGYHDSHVELIGYYKLQLELMQKFFGVDFTEAEKRINAKKRPSEHFHNPEKYYEYSAGLTIAAFNNCIKLLDTFKSPFDYRGMMEGMPPKINRDLREKYGEELFGTIDKLEKIYREIAKEILIFMFPDIESKQVERKTLYESGLPEEKPDLSDFF